jgi:hypothetical protein
MQKTEQAKQNTSTNAPNQSNRETAKAGPITEALPNGTTQVPHWDILLGTSKDNNEKIVGLKLRTNPQEKLKSRWNIKSF